MLDIKVLVEEIMKGVPAIEVTVDVGGERDIVDIREELESRIHQALTAERAKAEKAIAEARREMLRLVKEECLYPVDTDKEPSIQDEAYANMFESKCEAYWYGEQKANEHFLYNLQTLEDELT